MKNEATPKAIGASLATASSEWEARTAPLLSVVVPMRNEARNIDPLLARLVPAIEATGLRWEIVAVDDGSTDDTFAILRAMRQRCPQLRAISLSRNFGKEIALAAGLRHARGDAVVTIDADLQYPPETIPAMVRLWREGNPVVYGRRERRDRQSWLQRRLTRAFYGLFRWIGNIELDSAGGDFCLLDRRVVNALTDMPERSRFTRGLISWAGFRSTSVPVVVDDRREGRSQWRFLALMGLAVDAITSFGTLPLRIWTWMGSLIALGALGFGAYIFVKTLIFGIDVPGYPSLIVGIAFLAGVQLIGLGVIGEYVGRVFTEVKSRPLYLVQESVGFEPAEVASTGRHLAPLPNQNVA